MVEWVEVRGKTVDVAVAAAMQELSIADREGIDIEIIQEPEKGFLGMGGKDAIVRVKPRSQSRNRKRRRGRGEGESDRRPAQGSASGSRPQSDGNQSDRPQGGRSDGSRGGPRTGNNQGSRGRSQARPPTGQDRHPALHARPETTAGSGHQIVREMTGTESGTAATIRAVPPVPHERERQG